MYIDLLIRVKNAAQVGKKAVKVPYVKNDYAVAEILKRFGFLKEVEVKGRSFKKVMELKLEGARPVQGLKFLSRPSLRRYGEYRRFRKVKSGQGLLVVSTPKGILTGEDAKKAKVGGELLFEIW
jgi:small subunit ribosomal protein S8